MTGVAQVVYCALAVLYRVKGKELLKKAVLMAVKHYVRLGRDDLANMYLQAGKKLLGL